jgi:methylenetetrahydrofolate reductase (NADPH)
MHIKEILGKNQLSLSFEFFPARTEASAEELYQTIRELEPLKPTFVSITYGAGGGTRELTHQLVAKIKETTTIPPIPHLTCVGHTKAEVEQILVRYAALGVCNILALRGDPPRNVIDYDWSQGDFKYAGDLVRFIREFNESGRHPLGGFGIGVAAFPEGHPATPNRLLEMEYLKEKVDEGVDYICTQLFFDNHDFFDFRDRCNLAGIKVPMIAGIMPVTSLGSMRKMAELAAGSRFPAKLIKALARANADADAVEKVGIHYAAEQCAGLMNQGIAGIHFYTLNKSKSTREIYESLGMLRS